jgi:hypothetical protein
VQIQSYGCIVRVPEVAAGEVMVNIEAVKVSTIVEVDVTVNIEIGVDVNVTVCCEIKLATYLRAAINKALQEW